MGLAQREEYYTFADYYSWDDGQRWELIEGVPYAMSPAPSWRHQGIQGVLYNQLHNFLKGKKCKVFVSPIDVRLNAHDRDDTVVQPDVLVLCDKNKLDDHGVVGAPDMVIEILSPSTASKDMVLKLRIYRQAGVREYWIVDPVSKTVIVYLLRGSDYIASSYGETDVVPVDVLEGCVIDLSEVFEE